MQPYPTFVKVERLLTIDPRLMQLHSSYDEVTSLKRHQGHANRGSNDDDTLALHHITSFMPCYRTLLVQYNTSEPELYDATNLTRH